MNFHKKSILKHFLTVCREACFLLSKPQMRNCTFEAANTNWPLYLRLLCQNMSRVIDDFERRKLAVKKHWKLKKSVGVHQKDSKAKSSAHPIECDMNLSHIVKRILKKQMTSPNDYWRLKIRCNFFGYDTSKVFFLETPNPKTQIRLIVSSIKQVNSITFFPIWQIC